MSDAKVILLQLHGAHPTAAHHLSHASSARHIPWSFQPMMALPINEGVIVLHKDVVMIRSYLRLQVKPIIVCLETRRIIILFFPFHEMHFN